MPPVGVFLAERTVSAEALKCSRPGTQSDEEAPCVAGAEREQVETKSAGPCSPSLLLWFHYEVNGDGEVVEDIFICLSDIF